MSPSSTRTTVTALSLMLVWAGAVQAQTSPATPTVACAQPQDMDPAQLYGLWLLTLWPEGGSEAAPISRGALLFERHPDYPGSVRGDLRRSGTSQDLLALVSGDVSGGEFNLDESADGVTMDAVWSGTPQNCGRMVQGTRRPAEGRPAGEPTFHFLLKKTPDWR